MFKLQIVISWFDAEGKRTTEELAPFMVAKSSLEDVFKIEATLNESLRRRYYFNEVD